MLDALDIPREWLPPVSESTEIGGAGDQQAAALGVGVLDPGTLSVVLGTSGVVFAALPQFTADPEARLHVFCHAAPGLWEAMGVMLSAAGSLRWFRDALAPGTSYDDLTAEAETEEPGAGGVTFLPYLAGERTSVEQRQAAFTGLTLSSTREQMLAAVVEALAEASAARLKLFSELGIPMLRRVMLTGGAQGGLADLLHRDWPGRWTFYVEKEATLRGLGQLVPRER